MPTLLGAAPSRFALPELSQPCFCRSSPRSLASVAPTLSPRGLASVAPMRLGAARSFAGSRKRARGASIWGGAQKESPASTRRRPRKASSAFPPGGGHGSFRLRARISLLPAAGSMPRLDCVPPPMSRWDNTPATGLVGLAGASPAIYTEKQDLDLWTCYFSKSKGTFVLVENNKSTSPGLVFQRGLRDLLQQVQQVPGCLVGSSRQWRYDVALGEHLCHGTYGSQRGLQTLLVRPTKPSEMLLRMTAVGFEPTPLRNGALSRRRA